MISINENRRFKQLYARGRSFVGAFVVVYLMPNRMDKTRIGITVSKKIGKAVVRNRVRRRIKECVRLLLPKLYTGMDVVLVARVRAVNATYQDMDKNIRYLFKQGKCLKEDNQ